MDNKTEKTKLEEKLQKRIGESASRKYIADIELETKPQLEKRLLDLSKTQQGIVNTKNADLRLEELKGLAKEAARPYNEQLQANKQLQRLVSLVISERFTDELMDLQQPPQED